MDNLTFEKMENEIRSMFTKDTGNSTDNKYNIYKLRHSEYVSKIALLIYKDACKERAKKCDNNAIQLLHITALLHDTGKIRINDSEKHQYPFDTDTKIALEVAKDVSETNIKCFSNNELLMENKSDMKEAISSVVLHHADLSVIIAKELLIKYNISKEEKDTILEAIANHSEKENVKKINKLPFIARFIIEADLITKTYINDILSWYDNTIDLYNNLEYISSTVNKKYIKRRKILSNSGRKIGDKIEKDFNKFFIMAMKQRNLIEKR